MSFKSPESSKSAIKRNADESGSDTDSKRNKSDEREVNVDPIHDTALYVAHWIVEASKLTCL